MTRRALLPLAVLLLALAFPLAGADGEGDLRAELATFRGEVEGAVDGYVLAYEEYREGGDPAALDRMQNAGRRIGEAFLVFETGHGRPSSLSAFMQQKMPGTYYNAFERNVVVLRALMVEGARSGVPASTEDVQAQGHLVSASLDRAESCMPEGCRGSLVGTGAQAFLVLLREGFEAILLVGALVAYLRKSDRPERARLVYAGVGLALAATLVTWLLVAFVFDLAASTQAVSRAVLEGFTMLLAAAVLFYVSYWLVSKIEGRRWQQYLDGKLRDTLTEERTWALGLVGFLAVYREGLETALFLQALSATSNGAHAEMVTGLALGALALAGIYYAVHQLGVKIPLRPFFAVTSLILYFLAFRFAGLGVFELQEAGLLAVTPLTGLVQFLAAHPFLAFLLQDVAGFAPTVGVLAAQGLLVAAALFALGVTWWRGRAPVPTAS